MIVITSSVNHGGDAAKALSPFRNGVAKPLVDKVDVSAVTLAFSHNMDAQVLGGSCRIADRDALITDSWPELVLDVWNRWCKFTEDHGVKQTLVLWDVTRMDKLASRPDENRGVLFPCQMSLMASIKSSSPASDDAVVSFVSSTVEYVCKFDTEEPGKDLGVFVNLSRGNEDKIEGVFGVNLPCLGRRKAKQTFDNSSTLSCHRLPKRDEPHDVSGANTPFPSVAPKKTARSPRRDEKDTEHNCATSIPQRGHGEEWRKRPPCIAHRLRTRSTSRHEPQIRTHQIHTPENFYTCAAREFQPSTRWAKVHRRCAEGEEKSRTERGRNSHEQGIRLDHCRPENS